MFPSAANQASTPRPIFLVEEYSALAAAFAALLRSAAPDYQTRVFRSLGEAEAAAREQTPALLVVDVDPPQPGVVAALKRLRSAAPDLRVIVIAAENSAGIEDEPDGPKALRFVKKPFVVSEFTRMISESLAADSAAARTLRHLSAVDFIVLQAIAGVTAVLQIDSADGRSGEIHFVEGRIAHALVVGQTGLNAIIEILRWNAPRVREADRRSDAPRTIRGPWNSVLRDALRRAREMPNEPLPAVLTQTQLAPAGKKILVIDDTELLLVFVEEILSTSDPTLEIVTASLGNAGFAKALAERPDLILLDYSLPDISGGEVCARLLADERTGKIPVIMMSGHVAEMLAVAERYENVVATIAKPFVSSALIELLEHTLANLPKVVEKSAPQPTEQRPAQSPHSHNGHPPPDDDSSAADEPDKPTGVPPPQTSPSTPAPAPTEEPTPEPPEPPEVPPPTAPDIPPASEAESEVVVPDAMAPPPEEAATELVRDLPAAPTHVLATTQRNAVVVTFLLEVLSIQFSPSLTMKAIRARPFSPHISLHVLPETIHGVVVPEASFELSGVELNSRGQIDSIRVAPASSAMSALESSYNISLVGVSVLRASSGPAVELIPAPAAARLRLTALFELAGVELSAAFRVGHLVLKWRGSEMRVTQDGETTRPGVTFETAQVLLDRESHIAEFLLEAIA